MGKWAHPSVNRVHMKFAERPLSVSFLSGKLHVQRQIMEDYNIRVIANQIFAKNLMTNVIIERITQASALLIHIITNNSNNLVGSNSEMIDKFKKKIEKEYGAIYKNIQVGILAVKNIHTDVHTIARAIVFAIESTNGTNYMWLARSLAEQVHKNVGLLGIFIKISGRINGGTIASNQKIKVGTVKAQTLIADITQAVYPAITKTGMLGVKVILSREPIDRKRDPFDLEEYKKREFTKKTYTGKYNSNGERRSFNNESKSTDSTKSESNKPFNGDRPFNNDRWSFNNNERWSFTGTFNNNVRRNNNV